MPVVRDALGIFLTPRIHRGLQGHWLLDAGDAPTVLESVFHVLNLYFYYY